MTQEQIRVMKNELEAEQNRLSGLKQKVSDKQLNLQRTCKHPKKQKIVGVGESCQDCGWTKSLYEPLED